MESEPTVFVVDDDPAVRDSLRDLIESAGLAVESHASAREFLDAYTPDRPGCLVLDVRMPGMSGLDLQEHLREKRFGIPVIIITAHGSVSDASRSFKMGAIDFLEKPFIHEDLLARISAAIEKDARTRQHEARLDDITNRIARLTARERQVMDKVVTGCPNKRIATELGITQRTVEVHRAQVMEKMQAESLAELVRLVIPLEGKNQDA
jgi:RNA polymerase sigma factor (sigma-70 family)